MHPELRLIEDFLTDRGVLTLPALPRMLFVVRGSITVGQRAARPGRSAVTARMRSRRMPREPARRCGAGSCPIRASPPRRSAAPASLSRDKLAAPLDDPARGRSALARRQRGVSAGRLRLSASPSRAGHPLPDRGDAARRYRWAVAHLRDRRGLVRERARTRCSRRPADRPTRFVRVMILPRALIGKSSIQYVNEEDKDEAEDAAIPGVRRRAADAAGERRPQPGAASPGALAWIASACTPPASSPAKRRIDHAMAFDPALPLEGLRHNIDPEMRLPARPVARMAFVLVGFIHHAQALRRESPGQLFRDDLGGAHGLGLAIAGGWSGQSVSNARHFVLSSLRAARRASA